MKKLPENIENVAIQRHKLQLHCYISFDLIFNLHKLWWKRVLINYCKSKLLWARYKHKWKAWVTVLKVKRKVIFSYAYFLKFPFKKLYHSVNSENKKEILFSAISKTNSYHIVFLKFFKNDCILVNS